MSPDRQIHRLKDGIENPSIFSPKGVSSHQGMLWVLSAVQSGEARNLVNSVSFPMKRLSCYISTRNLIKQGEFLFQIQPSVKSNCQTFPKEMPLRELDAFICRMKQVVGFCVCCLTVDCLRGAAVINGSWPCCVCPRDIQMHSSI